MHLFLSSLMCSWFRNPGLPLGLLNGLPELSPAHFPIHSPTAIRMIFLGQKSDCGFSLRKTHQRFPFTLRMKFRLLKQNLGLCLHLQLYPSNSLFPHPMATLEFYAPATMIVFIALEILVPTFPPPGLHHEAPPALPSFRLITR